MPHSLLGTALIALLLAGLAVPARIGHAETVLVVGADGARGTNGAPGQPGGDGGDGESASALAQAPAEGNVARAEGGDGGSPGSGTPPGASGHGGDADAEAVAVDAASVEARASGGRSPGASSGGDATAIATLDTDRSGGVVTGIADALAGSASNGLGGSAIATLRVTNAGSADLDLMNFGRGARANGGSGGGSARSEAYGEGGGAVRVRSEAVAGPPIGLDPGSVGGDATALATGIGTGSGFVFVEARAVASAFSFATSGVARADASGTSMGGGEVLVRAFQASDVAGVMRDAVRGSTSGLLRLYQTLVATDALASLDATNPGGGDLVVDVTATGRPGTSQGPRGGNAIVESVTATAVGSVDVTARGLGGDNSSLVQAPAGVGAVHEVIGRSTGGADVAVRAHVQGGDSKTLGVSGADASLVNAVSAHTSGAVTLEQIAEAGFGRVSDGVPAAGAGFSRLDVDQASAFLDVRSEASGHGAEARSDATNRSGGVRLNVFAFGFGDAIADAKATSFGDGHDVTVGTSNTATAQGVDASSRSVGTAHGDARVDVYDHAKGESATSHASGSNAGASRVDVHAVAEGVNGGGGSVSATGSSSGGGDVVVRAEMLGGNAQGGQHGGAARIVDGVSGSTSGRLRLELLAQGGRAGLPFGGSGDGGAAHAELDQSNAGGGDLEIAVQVFGGLATGTGKGGVATLGPIVGRSDNGRDVTVDAFVRPGIGSEVIPIALIDAIDGFTTGNLKLVQRADSRGDTRSELTKVADATSLWVETETNAFGGRGTTSTARSTARNGAGDATSIADAAAGVDLVARAEAIGLGDATATALAASFSSATSDAEALAISEGDGKVKATARGAAGAATRVLAFGSNAGASSVDVSALAEHLSAGSEGALSAEGHSSGGGDVTVFADLRSLVVGREDIALFGAVSGSTAGRLQLTQSVQRFSGGPGPGDGDAITGLVATNPGGGALGLHVTSGAGGGPANGDAVIGDVVGTASNGSDVAILVRGFGDRVLLENRAADGTVTPARIFGESDGGDVEIETIFAVSGAGAAPVDGASIDLLNVADGNTSGGLSITQAAIAASGLDESLFFGSPAGSGGDARSVLRRELDVESVALHARSQAGASGFTLGSSSAVAGSAQSLADATNRGGAATASANAAGGGAQTPGGGGGDARAESHARSYGDGHTVTVGAPVPTRIDAGQTPGAFGGVGARSIAFFPGAPFEVLGDGGSATSLSRGMAAGDSTVTVHDFARGGQGGSASSFRIIDGQGGRGGDARSEAFAFGAGPSQVLARSEARGGESGLFTSIAGVGGDADARADAEGAGAVEAWARAAGGDSVGGFGRFAGTPGTAGSGHASAHGEGASGFARAEALTGRGALPQVRAQSEVSLGDRRRADATATHGAALPGARYDVDAVSFLSGAPLAADAGRALSHNAAAAQVFAESPSDWLALGRWQGGADEGGDSRTISTELEIVLSEDLDPATELMLAAFDVNVLGDAFEGLDFAIEKNGEGFGDARHFDTIDALIAFFADEVIGLGGGWRAGDSLLARFDLRVADATSVDMGVGFARVVPEPGTGVLLALGIVLLAGRRRSRRA